MRTLNRKKYASVLGTVALAAAFASFSDTTFAAFTMGTLSAAGVLEGDAAADSSNQPPSLPVLVSSSLGEPVGAAGISLNFAGNGVAAATTLGGLASGSMSSFVPGAIDAGAVINRYLLTVDQSISSFVSTITFASDILGMNILDGATNTGLFALGIGDDMLIFSGVGGPNSTLTPLSIEIYTAGEVSTGPGGAMVVPEPAAALIWSALAAFGIAAARWR